MDLIKVRFFNHNALGDILMMTCAVRDFKQQFGTRFLIDIDTNYMQLWENNPHLSDFEESDIDINLGPKKAVQGSNSHGLHYCQGYRLSMEQNFNLPIKQGEIKPDLYLTEGEKKDRWIDGRYWLVNTGGPKGYKFTSKLWHYDRWQKVVDSLPLITFVQIGSLEFKDKPLKGDNVINLLGKTEDPVTGIRDLMKLFYHCDGSLGNVSMHMHMAAAFDKAAVVVAGSREPTSFEKYNHHVYLSQQGTLRCKNDCNNCYYFQDETVEGKTRKACQVIPQGNAGNYHHNIKVCEHYDPIDPAKIDTKACWRTSLGGCKNQRNGIPLCLDLITVEDVVKGISLYYDNGALKHAPAKAVLTKTWDEEVPYIVPKGKKIFRMACNAHAYLGGEKSSVWIMNQMLAKGYHVQLCTSRGICHEFKEKIPQVEITNKITDPCDIFMIYANDMVFEFHKDPYPDVMPNVQAGKKILMINYKIGNAGKTEWTKDFDQYGFLCSQLRDDLLKLHPTAETFVLPPAVDLNPFLPIQIKYNTTLHFVRHNSQGDKKHPTDTEEMIHRIREKTSETTKFSFMPAPTFLGDIKGIHRYKTDQIPVPELMMKGNCYWYRLPEGYTDQGPRTIIEAMAAGLPCMADNRWGAKDRITPETGWLCDNDDDYMVAVINVDPKTLAKKGQAAKERAREHFDPENWIRQIES
jgi:ADP-heptose:LPS heptosyltransferase